MVKEKPQKENAERAAEPNKKSKSPGEHLFEVLKANNPEETLILKILEGQLPPAVYEEFRNAFSLLQKEKDIKARFGILKKLYDDGKISASFFDGLAAALFKEWEEIRKEESLKEEALAERKIRLGEKGKDNEKPLSRKESEEMMRAKLIEFLREADRLLAEYKGETPAAELQKIRGRLSSLGKDMRVYASSRIGALLLKEAERAGADAKEQEESKNRFLGHMEILLGEDDRKRLEAAYELYKTILARRNALGKAEPYLKSRFDDRPPFNLSNMEQIWSGASLILDTDESLSVQEKKQILSQIILLEDFLEKVGHDELKEKIRDAKLRRIEELKLIPEVQKVLEVSDELSLELLQRRNVLENIQNHQKEIEQRIREILESLVREEVSRLIDSPAYAKRIIADAIFLSAIKDELSREFRSIQTQGEPAEEIERSEAAKYSQFYFEKILRKKEIEASGASGEKKKALEDALSNIRKTGNYFDKLRLALLAGFINEEDYNQFLIFNEAHAAVVELKAKEREGEAAALADMNKENLRNIIRNIIRKRLEEAHKLYAEAENIRSGNL